MQNLYKHWLFWGLLQLEPHSESYVTETLQLKHNKQDIHVQVCRGHNSLELVCTFSRMRRDSK